MNDNAPLDLQYRPTKLAEAVYKDEVVQSLNEIINNKKVFRLLLVGGTGIGKTTISNILENEMQLELYFVNTQLCNKNEIKQDLINFCSTMSLEQKPKFVLFDEFDNADATHIQKPLLPLLEQFPRVSFMFTANDDTKITDAIKSRCNSLELAPQNATERKEILSRLLTRLTDICVRENIEYTNEQLINIIRLNKLDVRACIVSLDNSICDGKITNIIHCGITTTPLEFKGILKDYNSILEFINNNPFLTPSGLLEYINTYILLSSEFKEHQTKIALILHSNQKCNFINPRIFMAGLMLEIQQII